MNCDNVVGYFSHNLGLSNALKVELMCAILAIEIAHDKNWDHLWIQSDSKPAILAFKSPHIVP